MSFISFAVNSILSIISSSGYAGIFTLMTLESALIPIPSEIIMPFSGYLAWSEGFNLILIIFAGALGNLLGSIISYFLGLHVGRDFILKYGKYLLLKKKYLTLTEEWFRKYGDKTIFFSRVLPVVRTYVSLPAGIGRMNLKKFTFYTFFGSLPWCFALSYAGFLMEDKWKIILQYGKFLDLIVIFALVLGILLFFFKRK